MCQACDHDAQQHRVSADDREICRRLRSKTPQWWEREPGWVADEIRAELRRAGREWWPTRVNAVVGEGTVPVVSARITGRVVPLPDMTPAQLKAELAFQSRRLGKQPPHLTVADQMAAQEAA